MKKFFQLRERQHAEALGLVEEAARNSEMEFKSVVTGLESNIRERDLEITRLQETKMTLKEKVDDTVERLQRSEASCELLKEKTSSVEKNLMETKDLLDDARSMSNELDKELGQTNIRLEHANETIAKFQSDMHVLKEDHAKECENLELLKEEVVKNAKENAEQQQEALARSQAEVANLRNKVDSSQEDVMELQSRLLEVTAELDRSTKDGEEKSLRLAESEKIIDSVNEKMHTLVSNKAFQEEELIAERDMMQNRLSRTRCELGAVMDQIQVQKCLEYCVSEVMRQAEFEKSRAMTEERNLMQERLGDLYMKISTLPDFYQRQVF